MNKEVVTVPAAALAMGVSRIVLERAIKQGAIEVSTYNSGGKNPGFRLIHVNSFKSWLTGRKGYHEALKGGATKFHEWGDKINPANIVENALVVTNTDRVPKVVAKKAKTSKKAKVPKTKAA
jgi:hypothetical protein